MKIAVAAAVTVMLAMSPAIAKSAKSFAPGQQAKGAHGHSYYAPGQVKKRLHLKSARTLSPGYKAKH